MHGFSKPIKTSHQYLCEENIFWSAKWIPTNVLLLLLSLAPNPFLKLDFNLKSKFIQISKTPHSSLHNPQPLQNHNLELRRICKWRSEDSIRIRTLPRVNDLSNRTSKKKLHDITCRYYYRLPEIVIFKNIQDAFIHPSRLRTSATIFFFNNYWKYD